MTATEGGWTSVDPSLGENATASQQIHRVFDATILCNISAASHSERQREGGFRDTSKSRGKSGPALGGTAYRLMPSACRLIVRQPL